MMRSILTWVVLVAGTFCFCSTSWAGANNRARLRLVRADEAAAPAANGSADLSSGGEAASAGPRTTLAVVIDGAENIKAYRLIFSVPHGAVEHASWKCSSALPYCLMLDSYDKARGEYQVSVTTTGRGIINLGRSGALGGVSFLGLSDDRSVRCVCYELIDDSYQSDVFLATSAGEFVRVEDESDTENELQDRKDEESDLVSLSPNPFNARVEIALRLDGSHRIAIAIYDVSGRLVKSLVNNQLQVGAYRGFWDATDNKENQVASGVYFLRLTIDEDTINKKLMLLR